jgi:asparagine synthase (glutamine-hydrolysing)
LPSPSVFAYWPADVRLDNRTELLERLRQDGTPQTVGCSDGDLILACYRAWGTDAFPLLLGEFAVAISDGRCRRLVCARDPLGMRPLFYRDDGLGFRCAPSIRELFAAPGTPRVFCTAAVLDYLAGDQLAADATFFAKVYRVPAGHWVEAGPEGRVRCVPYWDPSAVGPAERQPAEWYAEQFRERFLQAVRARLPAGPARVGVHVSGGFDSAAVAAAVHYWNRQANLGLEPWAFVSTARLPAADEGEYVRAILNRYPMPVVATAAEACWAFRPAALPGPPRDEPFEAPYAARVLAELEAARDRGITVLLSGIGGDEIGGSSWYLVDLLLRGYLGRFGPELRARARARGVSPVALLRALLAGMAYGIRRTRRPTPLPEWAHPDLARHGRRAERLPFHGNPARRDVYDRLDFCRREPLLRAWQEVSRHFGVELRHPFLDRRLFEWALSVPPFRFGEDGRVKAPQRRALADLLPPAVLNRPDKGDYLHYWDLGLRERERPRVLRLFDRPVAERLGFFDGAKLRRAYDRYCHGGPINRKQLWNALTLEAWLRETSLAGASG